MLGSSKEAPPIIAKLSPIGIFCRRGADCLHLYDTMPANKDLNVQVVRRKVGANTPEQDFKIIFLLKIG